MPTVEVGSEKYPFTVRICFSAMTPIFFNPSFIAEDWIKFPAALAEEQTKQRSSRREHKIGSFEAILVDRIDA